MTATIAGVTERLVVLDGSHSQTLAFAQGNLSGVAYARFKPR